MEELGEYEAAEKIVRTAAPSHFRIAGSKCVASHAVFARLAQILVKRARTSLKQADFASYHEYCREVAQWCSAVHGTDHPVTHDYQNGLALAAQIVEASGEQQRELMALASDIQRANELYGNNELGASNELSRELVIRCRKLLGTNHQTTADTIDFTAFGELNAGNFGLALPMLEEVVEIRKNLRGEKDAMYAYAQGRLASAYSSVGRYDEATALFESAMKLLTEKNLKGFSVYLQTQLEYGRHLMNIGRMQEAYTQLSECLKAYLDVDTGHDPVAIKACERLVNIHRAMGNMAAARQLLDLQQHLVLQGDGNPARLQIDLLMQEATNLAIEGKLDEAIAMHRDAQARAAAMYGKRSHAYEVVLEELLETLAIKGDKKAVADVFGELLEYARLKRESLFAAYTVRQQFEQSASDRTWLNRLMALASHGYISDATAYEHLLDIKGAVTACQRRSQLAASNPELHELFARRQQIAAELFSIVSRPPSAEGAKRLEELAGDRDAVESEMSRRSAAYRTVATKMTLDRLIDALPEGTALVDYVEFERPPNWLERLVTAAPIRQIGVFVVTKQGGVKFVNLGASTAIEASYGNWRRAIGEELRNLGPSFDPQLERNTDQLGAEFGKLVWDPIKDRVANSESVIISPDGILVLCPFPALPVENGAYLIEKVAISHVTAPRLLPDLHEPRNKPSAPNLLLVGDIDYDAELPASSNGSTGGPLLNTGNWHFEQLPNARQELDPIRRHFAKLFPSSRVQELTRARASESNVRNEAQAAAFVHCNTHGFSIPLSELYGLDASDSHQLTFDPLVVGVAVAGANKSSSSADVDGILWASEIAMLDLHAADLVTLSACETALGELVPGEGFQGAQRAVTIAGGRASLTSMWSVTSKSTSALMAKFYENLWGAKKIEGSCVATRNDSCHGRLLLARRF
jgi:CHAT domain-containing protein